MPVEAAVGAEGHGRGQTGIAAGAENGVPRPGEYSAARGVDAGGLAGRAAQHDRRQLAGPAGSGSIAGSR